jgi:hypothetical protein
MAGGPPHPRPFVPTMTFATLTADAAYMRDQERSFLAKLNLTDEQLADLHQDSAKRDLRLDLQKALSLNLNHASDVDRLDGYIDAHAERMTIALSILQIVYVFRNASLGSGAAMNLEKKQEWEKKYRDVKADFPGLKQASGSSSTRIVRMRR